jgi:hypothetical protein
MASAILWRAPRLICSLIKALFLFISLTISLSLCLSLIYTHTLTRIHIHSLSYTLSMDPLLHPCRSHTLVCYPLIATIIFSEFDINAIQPGCRPKVPSGSLVTEEKENELIDGWGGVYIEFNHRNCQKTNKNESENHSLNVDFSQLTYSKHTTTSHCFFFSTAIKAYMLFNIYCRKSPIL